MDDELEKLENPTLQIKLQELYKNPLNSELRSAAVSAETITKLRGSVMSDSLIGSADVLLPLEALKELAALEIEQAKAESTQKKSA